jgi:hypothetical protein
MVRKWYGPPLWFVLKTLCNEPRPYHFPEMVRKWYGGVFWFWFDFWFVLCVGCFSFSRVWWFVCCLRCDGLCLVVCSNTQATMQTIGQQLCCPMFSLATPQCKQCCSDRSLAEPPAQRLHARCVCLCLLIRCRCLPPSPPPWPPLPSSSCP